MDKNMVYTKYEKARMIGSRALQISSGAPFMIKLDKEDLEKIQFDPLKIAKLEFDAGLLPIEIKRPMPVLQKKKK
jgi:DNA-directed RNA polymerase subunit K